MSIFGDFLKLNLNYGSHRFMPINLTILKRAPESNLVGIFKEKKLKNFLHMFYCDEEKMLGTDLDCSELNRYVFDGKNICCSSKTVKPLKKSEFNTEVYSAMQIWDFLVENMPDLEPEDYTPDNLLLYISYLNRLEQSKRTKSLDIALRIRITKNMHVFKIKKLTFVIVESTV